MKTIKLRTDWLLCGIIFTVVLSLIFAGDGSQAKSTLRNLVKNLPLSEKAQITDNREEIKKELIYWKKIAGNNPGYPDAWVKMAICWANLGEKKFARLSILKARRLDPVRKEIKEVENLIVDKGSV